MKEVILLTGSTGFLGAYLLYKLLGLDSNSPDIKQIIALNRGKTQRDAQRRTREALLAIGLSGGKRFEVICGDITQEKLGLPKSIYYRLIEEVTLIYHSAAICDFGIPLQVIRKANVDGTRNILDFALDCQKKGQFKRLHHISTIAVAGNLRGLFYEKDLRLGQKFNNTYEQSKFEAEKLVEEYRGLGLPIIIYRPSIIVGDSKTGYTNNFKMLYQPLHLFCKEFYKEIPASKDTPYSFVPVDCAAEAIIRISFDSGLKNNLTYHIVNPNEISLGHFMDIASRYFKFRKPSFISQEDFPFKKYSPLQLELLKPFIPYFNYKLRFNMKNSEAILTKTNFKWPKIDEVFCKRLFKFCIRRGFIKPKRT